MVSHVLVMPFVYKPYFDECYATMNLRLNNLLVDNTQENRGVANSWNLGIDKMIEENADWLVVASAAIRFGEAGGTDLLEQLQSHPTTDIIHFATRAIQEQKFIRGKGPSYFEGNLGWHLTAINKRVINKVGYFDPNFYPAYFEDIDYDLRINKAFPKVDWRIIPIDVAATTLRHAVDLAGVKPDINKLIAYFATKWGRHPSAAELGSYDYPFNNDLKSLAFFPPAYGRIWNEF